MSLPMSNRHRVLVRLGATFLFGLAALSLAACEKKSTPTTGAGGSASGTTTATAVGGMDICKMLSNEEVGALIGVPIVSSRRGGANLGEAECDYLSKDEAIAVALSIKSITKKDFLAQAKDYEVVTGIGEGAYENHGILTVLHKTNEITVIHGGSGHVEPQKRVAAAFMTKLDAASKGK